MWMVRNGIDVTPDIEQQIVYYEQRGQTVVLAAINSKFVTSASLASQTVFSNAQYEEMVQGKAGNLYFPRSISSFTYTPENTLWLARLH